MKKLTTIFALAVFATSCKVAEDIRTFSLDCPTPINSHEATVKLSERMKKAVDDGLVGAAVFIDSQKGEYINAAGTADLESQSPLESCHQFRIASLTKVFTSIATQMLIEEGKFNLETRVRPYLKTPIIDGIKDLEGVTIAQLLNHTSGIPNYDDDFRFAPLILNAPGADIPLQQKLSLIKGKGRTPQWVINKFGQIYSNSNYLILQLIIEQASGMYYEDYIIEKIIQPLNLAQTTFGNKERYPANLATGYVDFYGDDKMRNVNEWDADRFDAEGDIISTVGDVMTFFKAVLNGNLISNQTLIRMKEQRLGLLQEEFFLQNAMGHDGIGIGYSAELWHIEKEDFTIVLLSNQGRLINENWSVLKFENLLRDLIDIGR